MERRRSPWCGDSLLRSARRGARALLDPGVDRAQAQSRDTDGCPGDPGAQTFRLQDQNAHLGVAVARRSGPPSRPRPPLADPLVRVGRPSSIAPALRPRLVNNGGRVTWASIDGRWGHNETALSKHSKDGGSTLVGGNPRRVYREIWRQRPLVPPCLPERYASQDTSDTRSQPFHERRSLPPLPLPGRAHLDGGVHKHFYEGLRSND